MPRSIVAIIIFVVAFIGTSFLPVIMVRKGDEVIAHWPLYSIYGAPLANWRVVLIHLLASAFVTGFCLVTLSLMSKPKPVI